MSSSEKRFYEFGPFRLDPAQRVLWTGDDLVTLQPKAFDTLVILVQHADGVVLKDDLMRSVWPDAFVEESNLAQTIFVLRKALEESGGQRRYIVTVPGRGYRFVEKVRAASSDGDAQATQTQPQVPDTRLPLRTHPARTQYLKRGAILLVGLCLVFIAGAISRPTVRPKISRIRQITQIGSLIQNNKLFTDGPRIYFRVWEGNDRAVRYVWTAGNGEIFPVEKPFPRMDINDISRDGSEFLVVDLSSLPAIPSLWRVGITSASPRPVGEVHAREARWSPDGRTIAYLVDSDVYLSDSDGGHSRKLASFPGEAICPQWSPDGRRLRFSIVDASGGATLWEANVASGETRPLLPGWTSARYAVPGGWTGDGRYFFFTAWDGGTADGTYDVWALREQPELLRRIDPRPVQLTSGPLSFYQPIASKDGNSVFAVGRHRRGELLRYDRVSQSFVSYAPGRSADQVVYSRDGQWMAYVEFPECVLVRSRIDGSDRRQLTFPPMRAYSPQWSPDGTQLAFGASAKLGMPTKIYVIPRNGGPPVLAAPQRDDGQSYPSWLASGGSILFTSLDASGSNSTLWIVDLQNGRVAQLVGTASLRWGQISPDGRQVAALKNSTDELMLYDMSSHQTRPLSETADYPRWSGDGKYVYFRTQYFGHVVQNPGFYRWVAATNKVEKLFSDPEFHLSGVYGVWSGLTPDGSLLVLRDLTTADLYALDLELP